MNTTWTFLRPANKLLSLCLLAGFVIYSSCASNKEYQAPRMGAEYRFEDGMKADKHPQYLFDEKTRKDMDKMGLPTGYSNAATGPAGLSGKHFATDSSKVKDSSSNSVKMDTVYKVLPH